MPPRAGRHFLQIPGPSNVRDRILPAIDRPVIDHRGPEFARLAAAVLQGLKSVFKSMNPIVIYPAFRQRYVGSCPRQHLSSGDKY
jgi:alanine-glyoxylate transaminase / serine-glyoxylate transaminase / serine-pyruvate transaminase